MASRYKANPRSEATAQIWQVKRRDLISGIQLMILPSSPDILAAGSAAKFPCMGQSLRIMGARSRVMTKQILIADDSPFLREQLRLMIEQQHPGWHVSEAVDGAEAVRKSQQVTPDAVVLDLSMPEMNGLATGRRLKQLMPKLPMALFSIDTSSQLEKEAQLNGIRAVFAKTQWPQLLQWLETVLGNLPPTYHRARVPHAA